MSKYFTRLSHKEPELIEVNLKLTKEEMFKLRSQVDARASDTFTDVVRKLIKNKTSISKVKHIKG